MELARKILDELMGPDRNKMSHEKGSFGVRFYDPQVCKHALVGVCPYEVFLNTKSDIGACPCRYHDQSLKEAFEQSGSATEYREQYERDYLAFLEQLVSDLERKMKRGKDRITTRLDGPSKSAPTPVDDEVEERKIIIDLQIKELLAQIDKCGEEGHIRQAQELTGRVDALRAEADQLLKGSTGVVAPGGVEMNPLHKLEKQMELCSTCGALLIVGDAPKRVEAHFEGRQHNGWVQVRKFLEALRQKYFEASNSRRRSSGASHDRYVPDNRHSDIRRSRDRDHQYHHRSGGEHQRKRSRSRSRSRDRNQRHDPPSVRAHRHRDISPPPRRDMRPPQTNYVPGAGLDYGLEEGEVVEEEKTTYHHSSSKRSRSRSHSRSRSRSRRYNDRR